MKFTRTRTETLDVKFIKLKVKVHEEVIPKDMPFFDGEIWTAIIDVHTGEIQGTRQRPWPKGEDLSFEVYWKVTDTGTYALLDERMQTIVAIEEYYVPNQIIPGEFGDYIELNINDEGIVTNWPKNPSLADFNDC